MRTMKKKVAVGAIVVALSAGAASAGPATTGAVAGGSAAALAAFQGDFVSKALVVNGKHIIGKKLASVLAGGLAGAVVLWVGYHAAKQVGGVLDAFSTGQGVVEG